ncbi:MAG: YebC/PmpR family DNA-binding transcriptional regulator [Bacilli bacterium]|jgi:YebC/PmpR family DNA-binding regulatory protein|nr:YebC/PmpR family DNA-binding transcriptional regulator [Bacilli bacterium]
MGRAYEVRKAAIQKNGAAKAKIYSNFAKEIYIAAKNGGTSIEANDKLKQLVEKAKRSQVPSDIINRAIDKVNSGVDENYQSLRYEGFGPGASNLIVDCLTDNVNRTVGMVRPAFTKCNGKLGVENSVSHFYENLAIFAVKGYTEEEMLDLLMEQGADIKDIEADEDTIVITGDAKEYNNIKKALLAINPNMEFEVDEVSMVSLDKVKLEGEDLEMFNKLLNMLDEIEDVQNVYHNVEL